MKVTFKVEGGADLDKALSQLPARVSKRFAREALETAARPMQRAMASRAPRAPGKPDIADHIAISTARGSKTETNVAVGPERPYFYGRFLEYGTAFMSARPFMRPAFEAGVQRVIDTIKRSLWSQLASRGIGQTTSVETRVESDGRTL